MMKRIQDIDSKQMQALVHRSKRDKDRYQCHYLNPRKNSHAVVYKPFTFPDGELAQSAAWENGGDTQLLRVPAVHIQKLAK